MNPRITGVFIGIMVVACFVAGAVVYPHLPLVAASHWNAAGEPNGTLPRFWAAFLMPFIMLGLSGLWALLPRLDPIAPDFKGFRHVYDFFWVLLTAFFAYAYALMLETNLVAPMNIVHAVIPPLALLFIALGALLPLVKRNWFFGIRTPWSLSSDDDWVRTHQFASPLFVAAGVIAFFATFASGMFALSLTVGPAILAALASVVYSYLIYRAQR